MRGSSCSVFIALVVGVLVVVPRASADAPRILRVCSDPNNLPFSNERREGFENRLAEMLAKEMNAELVYEWRAQRRGFLRETIKAHRCDVVLGVPSTMDLLATTRPYYRSGYAFVLGPQAPGIRSLDAAALRHLTIGVPVVGDDGANPTPLLALARRGLIESMRGYPVYGNYEEESPPSRLVQAVSAREIDLAIAWGPVAGYFGAKASPPLDVQLIPATEAPEGMPFEFDISMGVRRDDVNLREELDAFIRRHPREIGALLRAYHVPVVAHL